VQRRGHVRRAKLYYLRERPGKATRIKERVGLKESAATLSAPEHKSAPAAESTTAAE
jgi:hypothetical protein